MENADKIIKENKITIKADNAFDATINALDSLRSVFPYYDSVMSAFAQGNSRAELIKRYMLKGLDEAWIKAVEDTIGAIDVIIRRPGVSLIDEEEIKNIELTRKVTSKSIMHLAQHTDMINEIKDDGSVIPSKLLNVTQDETFLTYENRFINTLILRVYSFVMKRYDGALAQGVDEKNTVFNLSQEFEQGDKKGKIKLSIEVSEPPEGDLDIKNHAFDSDLWKRLEKIVTLVKSYMSSPFVKQMGKNYVHPPIMRTNVLRTNVNFRQCLSLWEFMESYENVGYETIIKENLEDIDDEYLKNLYNGVIAQYIIFQNQITNDILEDKTLDTRISSVFKPRLKDELDPFDEDQYSFKFGEGGNGPIDMNKDTTLEEAIKIALEADKEIFSLDDEEIKEEPKQEIVDNSIKYKYIYSFKSRLILAQKNAQPFYSEIKNELLSYNDCESNISWSHELFKIKRQKLAKMKMKGKTLYLCLALDPKKFEDTKYIFNDESESSSLSDTPMCMKIKSDRAAKWAKELIAQMMGQFDVVKKLYFEPKKYRYPNSTPLKLANRKPPLVKLVNHELAEPETVEVTKYKMGLIANLTQSDKETQQIYTDLKNYLLSYNGIKSKVSFGHDSFRFGRDTLAKIKIRGSIFTLTLKLDFEAYNDTKYRVKPIIVDPNVKPEFLNYKIKGSRSLLYAKNLIDDMMKTQEITLGEIKNDDYSLTYKSVEDMLKEKKPLVKVVKAKVNKA